VLCVLLTSLILKVSLTLKKLYEPNISHDDMNYVKGLIKGKADGSYNIGMLSSEQIEAIKYIIEKNLMPEIELTLSPDFKNLVVKRI